MRPQVRSQPELRRATLPAMRLRQLVGRRRSARRIRRRTRRRSAWYLGVA
jgi:hypothetical protein